MAEEPFCADQRGVAVALHHLGGGELEADPEAPAYALLHRGIQVREGAHGTGHLAHGRLGQRAVEPLPIAAHLRVEDQQLEPKGHGLGVHPVGASDAGRVSELQRAATQRLAHTIDAFADESARIADLQRQRRVQHVAGRHPIVEPARLGPDALGDAREERDHVVPDVPLDLRHPVRVDAGAGAQGVDGIARNLPPLRQHLADGQLDVEPIAVLPVVGPDVPHLRPRVAIDHEPLTSMNT
jgi:hypothetical protein